MSVYKYYGCNVYKEDSVSVNKYIKSLVANQTHQGKNSLILENILI